MSTTEGDLGLRRRGFGEETASSELILVRRGGKTRVRLRVGKPYRTPTGEWACPVECRGVEPRYTDIRGEDSLQALCLAISFLRLRVDDIMDRGNRLLHIEDGTEWDQRARAATFGTLGSRRRGR